jgi:lycopene beta-cyclase
MTASCETDYALVGGGLQNALMLLALAEARPNARITLLERGPRLGGNHTWSFHLTDLGAQARVFAEPLIQYRWPGYEVAFPHLERRFSGAYCTTTSAFLEQVVGDYAATRPNITLRFDAEVESVSPQVVSLPDGEVIRARVVIDSRGPGRLRMQAPCGYQKFVGLELKLASPAPRAVPLLKDNRVPQTDGYRFMYVLPFAPDHVLIEDTYYADTPYLDESHSVQEVLTYAERNGFHVAQVLRQEQGALPIPRRHVPITKSNVLLGGYGGGWFHPTTGYSFPMAARLAAHVAVTEPENLLGAAYGRIVRRQQSQARFCALLNRMLFEAYPPEERWHVLERFHRLPEDTIERFYALELTWRDRWRILAGRPPKGLSLRFALKRGLAL